MVLAICVCGCSFVFVRGPSSDRPRGAAVDCTSSVVAPVLDLIWAGLNGAGAVNALATDDATWNRNVSTPRSTVIGVGLFWVALSGASAIYGFKTTDACRQAVAAQAPMAPPPAVVPEGCSRDVDCKGDRICVRHECVAPEPR